MTGPLALCVYAPDFPALQAGLGKCLALRADLCINDSPLGHAKVSAMHATNGLWNSLQRRPSREFTVFCSEKVANSLHGHVMLVGNC